MQYWHTMETIFTSHHKFTRSLEAFRLFSFAKLLITSSRDGSIVVKRVLTRKFLQVFYKLRNFGCQFRRYFVCFRQWWVEMIGEVIDQFLWWTGGRRIFERCSLRFCFCKEFCDLAIDGMKIQFSSFRFEKIVFQSFMTIQNSSSEKYSIVYFPKIVRVGKKHNKPEENIRKSLQK